MNNIFMRSDLDDEHIIKENIEKFVKNPVYFDIKTFKDHIFFLVYLPFTSSSFLKRTYNFNSFNLISKYKYGSIIYKFSKKTYFYDYFGDNKYLPKSILQEKNKINKKKVIEFIEENGIVILRPEGRAFGNGIVISDKIDVILKELSKQTDRCIISKYIDNPLLINEKKFHIRYYVIVVCEKNLTKIAKLKYHKLNISDKKYVNDKFDDKDIHNIHNEKDIFFCISDKIKTNDLDYGLANEKINKMLKYFFKESIDFFNYYKQDCEIGFDILGLDIMFDEKYNPYLIEINQKTSYEKIKDEKKKIFFANHYYNGIFSFLLTNEKENDSFEEIIRRKY